MPAKTNHRIIIDTNLWISFLLTNNYAKLDVILSKEKKLLFSQQLIEEFVKVVQRPKLKKYFTNEDIENLLFTIGTRATFIKTTSEIKICRDPKDNFILALAVDGKATHLLTGDKDLLVLEKIEDTQIITIANYLLDYSII
jgi:hypothetical protein